jgi:fructose-bisphosphate aldolase class I
VLKPSMVLPGTAWRGTADLRAVAAATVTCYRRTVPAAVAGIALLSGGQGDLAASAHLNAIQEEGPLPWRVTFSYGRALQDAAMAAWRGDAANAEKAQSALARRARANSLASIGRWSEGEEEAVA